MKDAARAPREAGRVAHVALDASAAAEADTDDGIAPSSGVPAWQRDALAVSARVRALLHTLQPVVVRVLTFWDHAVRAVVVAGRRLEVDPSGSYRIR